MSKSLLLVSYINFLNAFQLFNGFIVILALLFAVKAPNGAGLAYRLMDSFIDRPQNIKVISLGQIGLKESHIMLEYGHKTADKFARWYSWFEFKIWSGKLKQKEASPPDNISFISGRNTFEHEQILARIDAIGA